MTEADHFCAACGLATDELAAPGNENRHKSRDKSRRLMFVIVAAMLAVLIFAGWLITHKPTDGLATVRQPVYTYLDHIARRRLKEAYEMTSSSFRSSVPERDFTAYLLARPYLTNIGQRSFSVYEWKHNNASVSGILISLVGSVTPVEFKLIKEEGAWRIMSAKVPGVSGGARDQVSDK